MQIQSRGAIAGQMCNVNDVLAACGLFVTICYGHKKDHTNISYVYSPSLYPPEISRYIPKADGFPDPFVVSTHVDLASIKCG